MYKLELWADVASHEVQLNCFPPLHCDRKTTGEALGLGLAKANMYILDLLKSEVALPL